MKPDLIWKSRLLLLFPMRNQKGPGVSKSLRLPDPVQVPRSVPGAFFRIDKKEPQAIQSNCCARPGDAAPGNHSVLQSRLLSNCRISLPALIQERVESRESIPAGHRRLT